MKLILHGNDILCKDLAPHMKVGMFTDVLITENKKKLILDVNFGPEFINLYRKYRNNMHIANVAELICKMENLHVKYESELFNIRRNGE